MLSFRRTERRRTVRVSLRIPLAVRGRYPSGEDFNQKAYTLSISADGGLLALDAQLMPGQTFVLTNELTGQSVECRVTSARHGRDGKHCVGVGFVEPGANFWHMVFPKAGMRPATRAARTGVLVQV